MNQKFFRDGLDRLAALAACSTLLLACAGSVPGGGDDDSDDGSGGTAVGPGRDRGEGGGDGGGSRNSACRNVGPAPLRRLNTVEYRNTMADLFPGVALPLLELSPDVRRNGFENNALAQTPSDGLVAQFGDATSKAVGAVTDLAGLIKKVSGCAWPQADCVKKFVRDFSRRAYRRTPLDEELTRLDAFLDRQTEKYDAELGLRMTVQAILLSPQFLYRPEIGAGLVGEELALSGPEVATRMSYFLWQSMPDDDLLDAAEHGGLDTAVGIEAQARRMLGDPRTRRGTADFMRQWLQLYRIDNLRKDGRDATLFPAYRPELADRLGESLRLFLDNALWEGDGTLETLLTRPVAFVDKTLAPLYGVTSSSSELKSASLDPTQRAGLLTQAGLLAALGHKAFDSPVLRGVFVLDALLCAVPPPPPGDVVPTPPENNPSDPRTTRERTELHHSNGASCVNCHQFIDPIGFLFNNYDALGAYRTKENGFPVDATGTLSGYDDDLDGSYDGLIELSRRLGKSPRVAACAGSHLLRFALGRDQVDGDTCTVEDAMRASGGSLRETLISLVTTDAFRFRPVPEESP